MTMVGGMQGFTMGDAAYHRNEPDYKRELAQAKELLANQTKYIKTLQEENLRLLKDADEVLIHVKNCAAFARDLCDKEALIAELIDTLKCVVPIDSPYCGNGEIEMWRVNEALEKVWK